MKPVPITDSDINAYVDNQAAPRRRQAVDEALLRDQALADRVALLERQNAALRDGFDLWLDEPIPERLIAAAVPPAAVGRRPVPRWIGLAAAAAASLAIGLGGGWFARELLLQQDGTPTTFSRQAALTHALYASDINRPVEIWAAEEQRLVNWLTKRLGIAVRAPDLNSVGYALVGGRLVAGNELPTALFMYENADKQRLSLQVRKQVGGRDETAFRYALEGGVGVYYWIDDNCSYALSGNVDRAQLLVIGRVVYGQLAAWEAGTRK
jgi:anti-sigma factor RsiW